MDSWTEFFGGFFGGIFPHEKCQVGEVLWFVEPGFGLFFGMTPGLLMEFFLIPARCQLVGQSWCLIAMIRKTGNHI